MGPLSGIKVLDLSRLLPGPLCTHFLVRLGASVVKVDQPDGGDYVRYIPPMIKFPDGAKHGAVFEALNSQKKNIVIDFKKEDGTKILKRLVRSYDVLVEGNRPGVMQRLGLGYEDLRKENPRLIYCSLTGYGATGPYQKRAGHDINYMALAGMIGLSGKPKTLPPLPGFQGADASGALQAVIGIQSAIIERFSTNVGQYVDVSLAESAMTLAVPSLATHLATGGIERGTSHLDGGLINYNIYETKDGKYLTVGALEDHFWKKFCEHVGAHHLIVPSDKQNNSTQLAADTEALFRSKTLQEWLAISQECDACLEPVWTPAELPSHPQHIARNVFIRRPQEASVQSGKIPPQMVLGPRLSNNPEAYLRRASKLGEDTNDIMHEGGYTLEEINALRQSGVVA